MRKRDRLKRGVRRLLGHSGSSKAAEPAAASAPQRPVVARPPAAPRPTPPVSDPGPPSENPTVDPDPNPSEPSTGADGEADEAAKAAEMAAKAAKHFERTRRAMLKFVVDQGGTASLADMHDRSERRYFIGHKRFSTLMEGLVDEGLIDFDHATGVAAITAAGSRYIESD